jgi:hypothetical protein
MSKLVKYFEFLDNSYLSEDELFEMANVTEETTGIKDVVIWIGPNPKSHGKRVKISNIPNKISSSDCFTITIPKFEIVGEMNTKFIDSIKLENIKKFISNNLSLIEDYSDYKISTKQLLDGLKPI